MSPVADLYEWREGVVQRAATDVGADHARELVRKRTLRLFLLTIIERWRARGLSIAEIQRGLGLAAFMRATLTGYIGVGNAAGLFQKDADGRWHPAQRLRTEPWVDAARRRRPT